MQQTVGVIASGVGHAVRLLLAFLSWVPVVAGPALILYGIQCFSRPAAYIAAGLFLSVGYLRASAKPKRGRGK